MASTLLAASVAPTLARYEPSRRVTDSDQLADVAPGVSRVALRVANAGPNVPSPCSH